MKGIYLLIHNNEIIYIGKTNNIKKRLNAHLDKQWDNALILPYHYYSDRTRVEKRLIKKYKPKHNKHYTMG